MAAKPIERFVYQFVTCGWDAWTVSVHPYMTQPLFKTRAEAVQAAKRLYAANPAYLRPTPKNDYDYYLRHHGCEAD